MMKEEIRYYYYYYCTKNKEQRTKKTDNIKENLYNCPVIVL